MSNIIQGLTFDDVLLVPQYSDFLPSEADTRTKLTKEIEINIPLVSAAMDTVTEYKLAIKMALNGGIGIIHKNMSPKKQAHEVELVKRYENGFISDPKTLGPEATIEEVYNIRQKYGYKAVPITDDSSPKGKLLGLITANSYFINKHRSLKVTERMIQTDDLLLAEEGISLEEAYEILEESKHSKLIIINNKKELRGLVTRRDIEKNRKYPNSVKDKKKRLLVGAAVGPAKNMEERVEILANVDTDIITVDTAHGHSKGVIDTIKYIKKQYPHIQIIAGNIATPEAVKDLAKAGADAIKVGIGPGSICTTRIVAGIGVPQLTAIMECSKEAKKHGIPVIADGGIKYSGDIAKALAAGASTVMIGSLLAGTDESPGELVYSNGKTYKIYRGMGSMASMVKGGKERYGQGLIEDKIKFVPEGIEGLTVYKGSVSSEIYQLVGGLKSSMGYQGARNIEELQRKAQFIQITNAGLRESHPHDVVIMKEAPNYRDINN